MPGFLDTAMSMWPFYFVRQSSEGLGSGLGGFRAWGWINDFWNSNIQRHDTILSCYVPCFKKSIPKKNPTNFIWHTTNVQAIPNCFLSALVTFNRSLSPVTGQSSRYHHHCTWIQIFGPAATLGIKKSCSLVEFADLDFPCHHGWRAGLDA